MRQLLLLRHAESDLGDPAQADHARALNAHGQRQAGAIRAAMRELGLAPDIVLVSSAQRALDTLLALEPWDDSPLIEVLETLYLAPALRLLSLLHDVAETARRVLVIAHNPGIHELTISLAGEQAVLGEDAAARALTEGFPTATMAVFSIPGPWRQLQPGRARLLHVLRPRDLPQFGQTPHA